MDKLSEISAHLRKLPFWDKMTAEERELSENNARIHKYPTGSTLECMGSCLGMIYVVSGCIRVYLLSEEGREVTLFRVHAGEVCVMTASCVIQQITFDVQVEAEQECKVLVLFSDAFAKLTESNIYVRCYMYELMTERFSKVVWVFQQILFARFDQRLARWLLSEAETTESNTLKVTQEEIAKQVNSAREVVARMLRQFSADGLVEVRRGEIILKSVSGLRCLL